MHIAVNMYKNEYYHIHSVDTFEKDGDDFIVYAGKDTSHEVKHTFDLLEIESILIFTDDEANDEYDENERAKWGILA